MIIGGSDGSSNRRETHFVNMASNTVSNGPNLLTARRFFGCHTMNVSGEEYIIVAGGYWTEKSTEYLPVANSGSGWQNSKNWTVV